jgi:Flp pilus assembly protein TadB
MELPSLQTWIIFYLISFVLLLWAAFLSAQGVMLWVSLFLVIVVVGVNFWVVSLEVKKHAARKALQRSFTSGVSGEQKETVQRVYK